MEPRTTHARKEYEQAALDEATIASDPIHQFAAWYDAAVAAGLVPADCVAGEAGCRLTSRATITAAATASKAIKPYSRYGGCSTVTEVDAASDVPSM